MAKHAVTGESVFSSNPFSNRWELWSHGERLAVLHRRPRQHVSEVALADGRLLTLLPDGWGTVVAIEGDKEWGRVLRSSWWGRRWELESPTFGYALTSDLRPRRWTIRVGNEPVGRLTGGLLSYNRLEVQTDVAIAVLPLVMSWHVLARPWEAASAPGSLVPRDPGEQRPTLGVDG